MGLGVDNPQALRPSPIPPAYHPERLVMTSPKAVVYLRRHLTEGTTDTARAFAREKGLELESVFTERVSRNTPLSQRPQLQAAIDALEKGSTLIVSTMTDLAGKADVMADVLRPLRDKNATVITYDGVQAKASTLAFQCEVVKLAVEMERQHIEEMKAAGWPDYPGDALEEDED